MTNMISAGKQCPTLSDAALAEKGEADVALYSYHYRYKSRFETDFEDLNVNRWRACNPYSALGQVNCTILFIS